MLDHPLLARLVLGYSAVIDRQRSVVATRLTLAPATSDSGDACFDGAEIVQWLGQAWPEAAGALSLRMRPLEGGGGAKATAGLSLLVNAAGESLLQSLLAAPATPRFGIEVPAFMVADPALAAAVQTQAEAGATLALKGLPREPLPAALAASFALLADDPSAPAPKGGSTPRVRLGVRTPAELEAAFAAGCVLVAGWPFGEPPAPSATKKAVAPELQVILELINRVDREEPVDRLEAVLKNDPTLAFRLIRYINSPGFGLSVEIGSFRHALMILGYQKLKRWLALLLASASKDANMKPMMFAAVRRGLIMEELVKGSGDAELRGELFICGVFSLLDRLLGQSFADLLRSVPVPEKVRLALLGEEGPFLPYLELVQAIEQESVIDVREKAERLMLSVGEVNRALLAALTTAAQLE
ncbi:MAG: histidine kinase [Rubrivivax sp. SCN 71-131]|jgi:EAL and modified HD-GYP domain-containing signal transduction protein|nr:MAG: histidine kinase [Rubrivivax sp. SCN 71-131]